MSILRTQLLGAIAAGFAVGCKAEAPPSAPITAEAASLEPAPSAPAPAATASTEAAISGSASGESSSETTSSDPARPPGTCEPGSKRTTHTLAVGKAPPKQIPNPKISYDANGCASAADVSDNCLGIEVLSGPVLKGKQCVYTICKGREAPCGRLLLDLHGQARMAPLVHGVGWADASTLARDMPAAARAGWLQDARLEHASVAAFARFSLELLAIGAPAGFLVDAHRAALDEIEHARLCFALAGDAVSTEPPQAPGPLSLELLPIRSAVADIVRAAMEECCCGETFAALVAQRALLDCAHPEARQALERIAADEARHAELGWRFVAWAIAHFGVSARTAAAEGLASGLLRLDAVASPIEPGLEAYGRLSSVDLQIAAAEATTMIRQLDASLDLQVA